MKSLLLNLLSYVVKTLIDAKLFKYIQDSVVILATRTDLSGAEKREALLQGLEHLKGDVEKEFRKTGASFINFAIEAAVVLFKGGKIG